MVDIDLNNVPSVPLKIVFAVHFVLTTWGIQGYWSPDSYLYYNLLFLVTLLWAMHSRDREEPVQIAMGIDAVSVILDLFTIGGYFPAHSLGDKFSVGMAIVNLVFRPISVLILGKICAERMGLDTSFPTRFSNLFGQPQATEGRGPYEDIEAPHQSVPRSAGHSSSFSPNNPPPYH